MGHLGTLNGQTVFSRDRTTMGGRMKKELDLTTISTKDLAKQCQRLGYQVWNLVNWPSPDAFQDRLLFSKIKVDFEDAIEELKRRSQG